jgi:putative nucleotidyltransferase with HDIG domain
LSANDPHDKPTILVVDDELGPRESLRMILEPSHQVIQACSGADALEILRTESVDLLTLDLNMPGMKGEDVMRTVRSEFPRVEIIVITGAGSIESAAEGIRSGICDYIQKPFDVVHVSAAVSRALARHASRRRLTSFLEGLGSLVGRDQDAEALLGEIQRSRKLRAHLSDLFDASASAPSGAKESDSPNIEFLEVLAETIETKDRFMRGHARRVSVYAGLLADRLNLSARDQEQVRIAAFLHDLGKVGVPTDLLLRPGALEAAERVIVEEHPVIGARLVKPLDIPTPVSLAIRHHHEWWDGSGYPDGLAGEEIPLLARIISVVDAYDAMACDRPHRKALTRPALLTELERFAGVQFDPNLAREFIAILQTGVCDGDREHERDTLGIIAPRAMARA